MYYYFYTIFGGVFLTFIIPKNYKFKNKIFGIIDYSTGIINIIWNIIIYLILKNISASISIKIFIFSLLSFPILLCTIIGFNSDSPISVFRTMFRFFLKPKTYIFKK